MKTDPKALADALDYFRPHPPHRVSLPGDWYLGWVNPEHMTCGLFDPQGKLVGNLLLADAERFAAALRAPSSAETMRERCAAYHDDLAEQHDALDFGGEWHPRYAKYHRRSAAAIRALPLPDPGSAPVERVRHAKRGTEYEVIGEAALQIATENGEPRDSRRMNDYDPVMVYRSSDTGCLWVRPYDEFHDGRFTRLDRAQPDPGPAPVEGWRPIARPLEEWHEDMGDVLWWRFPIEEPPYCGGPHCLGQTVEVVFRQHGEEERVHRYQVGGWPGYHTHFTTLPPPPADLSRDAQEGERS